MSRGYRLTMGLSSYCVWMVGIFVIQDAAYEDDGSRRSASACPGAVSAAVEGPLSGQSRKHMLAVRFTPFNPKRKKLPQMDNAK